ncbi:unnamed protein product [Prunus brigantina]
MRPPLWAWLHSHQPAQNLISPHTSGRTRPRMGSVNTTATPTTRATSTQSQGLHRATRHYGHFNLPRKVTLPRKCHGQTRDQTTHPGSNEPAWPMTSKFQSDNQHINNSGPSNGPNLANPKNAQYAISVRDSNGIQIEIREILCARDN